MNYNLKDERYDAWLTNHVRVHFNGNYPVFENDRGLMQNGNRRIHMKNWTLDDLRACVDFLERNQDALTKVAKL